MPPLIFIGLQIFRDRSGQSLDISETGRTVHYFLCICLHTSLWLVSNRRGAWPIFQISPQKPTPLYSSSSLQQCKPNSYIWLYYYYPPLAVWVSWRINNIAKSVNSANIIAGDMKLCRKKVCDAGRTFLWKEVFWRNIYIVDDFWEDIALANRFLSFSQR